MVVVIVFGRFYLAGTKYKISLLHKKDLMQLFFKCAGLRGENEN
jgi:hypothetical protein